MSQLRRASLHHVVLARSGEILLDILMRMIYWLQRESVPPLLNELNSLPCSCKTKTPAENPRGYWRGGTAQVECKNTKRKTRLCSGVAFNSAQNHYYVVMVQRCHTVQFLLNGRNRKCRYILTVLCRSVASVYVNLHYSRL